jgi:hypothetical protein
VLYYRHSILTGELAKRPGVQASIHFPGISKRKRQAFKPIVFHQKISHIAYPIQKISLI